MKKDWYLECDFCFLIQKIRLKYHIPKNLNLILYKFYRLLIQIHRKIGNAIEILRDHHERRNISRDKRDKNIYIKASWR